MNPEIYKRIIRPLLTEKGTDLNEKSNQVIFEVEKGTNKYEIKKAVEQIFKVTVENVNTVVMRGKIKRVGKNFGKRPNWKKAYVTLKEGDKINFFEGV